jgi:hypothetical protein
MEKNEHKLSEEIGNTELPPELWHHIMEYCSVLELLELRFINRAFRSPAADLLRLKLKSFHLQVETHINGKIILRKIIAILLNIAR